MKMKGHQLETAAIFLGPDSLFYNADYYCLKKNWDKHSRLMCPWSRFTHLKFLNPISFF